MSIFVLADAAALANLDGHRARDDHSRRRRDPSPTARSARMKRSPSALAELSALAARAFGGRGGQRPPDAGRMELHDLHVLQRQAGAEHHGIAVASLGMRSRCRTGNTPGHSRRWPEWSAALRNRWIVPSSRLICNRPTAAVPSSVHDRDSMAKYLDDRTRRRAAAPGRTWCAAWRGRCGRRRRRCAARCPCRNASSCRRTMALVDLAVLLAAQETGMPQCSSS